MKANKVMLFLPPYPYKIKVQHNLVRTWLVGSKTLTVLVKQPYVYPNKKV